MCFFFRLPQQWTRKKLLLSWCLRWNVTSFMCVLYRNETISPYFMYSSFIQRRWAGYYLDTNRKTPLCKHISFNMITWWFQRWQHLLHQFIVDNVNLTIYEVTAGMRFRENNNLKASLDSMAPSSPNFFCQKFVWILTARRRDLMRRLAMHHPL